jgi:hypothetical protein
MGRQAKDGAQDSPAPDRHELSHSLSEGSFHDLNPQFEDSGTMHHPTDRPQVF